MPNNDILELLLQNRNKNFVQRILEADRFPQRQNLDRTTSSHLMASGKVDNRNIVFPTLVQDRRSKSDIFSAKQLFFPYNPLQYALENDEFIEIDDEDLAIFFAEGGYKEFFNYRQEPQQQQNFLRDILRLIDEGF